LGKGQGGGEGVEGSGGVAERQGALDDGESCWQQGQWPGGMLKKGLQSWGGTLGNSGKEEGQGWLGV